MLANFNPNEMEARADGFLPAFDLDNENKRGYLVYRVCGFSRKEARDQVGVASKTVKNWVAEDKAFAQIEKLSIVEVSSKFRKDVVVNGWVRNYWLMLEKDARVIKKSESDKVADYLSEREHEYLMKIRPMYTPAAMKVLNELFDNANEAGSWEEWMIRVRRSTNASPDNGKITFNESPGSEEEYTEGTFSEQDESKATWD